MEAWRAARICFRVQRGAGVDCGDCEGRFYILRSQWNRRHAKTAKGDSRIGDEPNFGFRFGSRSQIPFGNAIAGATLLPRWGRRPLISLKALS